ncbi:MAG: PAC2 family protein, partial [Planctomycetes bacterium]|nr:PAC2 family protein [Planctomycetota bacterium]
MSTPHLDRPWLVAVWPGMGNVGITAGFYLMAKLGMELLTEFSAHELFDVEAIRVKGGLIQPGQLPRSRVFVGHPEGCERDILVFIGESQPPSGKYAFCHRIVDYAASLGVERVFTFAAMATEMETEHESRVFGAATDATLLSELREHGVRVLEDGQIGGLNGVLIGAAADRGLPGACLLGEMPHVLVQLPFPRASLAVLQAFSRLTGIEVDYRELREQTREMERRLVELLSRFERTDEERDWGEESSIATEGPRSSPEDESRIESLFAAAREDRSKAYELK